MESPHRDIPDDIKYKQSISPLVLLTEGLLVWVKSAYQALIATISFLLDHILFGASGLGIFRLIYNGLIISGIKSNSIDITKYDLDKKSLIKKLHEKNEGLWSTLAFMPILYDLYFVIVLSTGYDELSFGLSCGAWGMIGFTALAIAATITVSTITSDVYESEEDKKKKAAKAEREARRH